MASSCRGIQLLRVRTRPVCTLPRKRKAFRRESDGTSTMDEKRVPRLEVCRLAVLVLESDFSYVENKSVTSGATPHELD